ncbi:hypothetical protein HMPREF1497_1577 [Fusobacterium sp. CM21]|nr:hypothetical protein HMPREF1497_1577 [Fusobacterium sp. CM21]
MMIIRVVFKKKLDMNYFQNTLIHLINSKPSFKKYLVLPNYEFYQISIYNSNPMENLV